MEDNPFIATLWEGGFLGSTFQLYFPPKVLYNNKVKAYCNS